MNITLPLLACPFVELPENGTDCSISQPNICIRCPIAGKFIGGGGLDDRGSTGHVITLLVWILTVIVGGFGALSNCLIIIIMKRKTSRRAFDQLLIALACFDLVASVNAVIATTTCWIVFRKISRSLITLYILYFSKITCLFARSGSIFMTVLITLERYLVIRFPIISVPWFTSKKTKCWIGLMLLLALFIAIPRYGSLRIVPNNLPRDIASIANFDYLILATPMATWLRTLKDLSNVIDFWLLLPLLLFLNFLLYLEIRKFAKRRKQMSLGQKKEIRAIKMFIPVVVVLFICNIEPYLYLYYIKFEHIIAREHLIGVCFSVAVNASVNLPIYYFKGGSFRREVKALFFPSRGGSRTDEMKMGRRGTISEDNTGLSGVTGIRSSFGATSEMLKTESLTRLEK